MVGMTTEKIGVTVPQEVLRKARGAIRHGAARTLSEYVTIALQQKTMLDDLDSLLQQMLAESGGPLTPAEIRRAELALGAWPPRKRRR